MTSSWGLNQKEFVPVVGGGQTGGRSGNGRDRVIRLVEDAEIVHAGVGLRGFDRRETRQRGTSEHERHKERAEASHGVDPLILQEALTKVQSRTTKT